VITILPLDVKENQTVEVKGFLYRDAQGEIVLTDTPNLKSCCVGKPEVSKIYLSGSFPEKLPVQLAVVRGILKGNTLSDAKMVSSAGSGGIIFVGLFFVALTAYFLKKRR